jgi:hypothetical protein
MAASARGPVDKAAWSQMAKRCLACAEHYEGARLPRAVGCPDSGRGLTIKSQPN